MKLKNIFRSKKTTVTSAAIAELEKQIKDCRSSIKYYSEYVVTYQKRLESFELILQKMREKE